jgi:hypothetical protein
MRQHNSFRSLLIILTLVCVLLAFNFQTGLTVACSGIVPQTSWISVSTLSQAEATRFSDLDLDTNERTLVLELADESYSVGITDQGRITSDLAVSTSNKDFSLSITSGTQVLVNDSHSTSGLSESAIPQKITVRIPNAIPELPDGWVAVSAPYSIEGVANGTLTSLKMDKSVLLVIKYDDVLLPDNLADLATFFYDNEMGWTQLQSTEGFIAEGLEVATKVDHFSLFVVLAKSSPIGNSPSSIVVRKLSITPSHILLGQSSEVRIRAVNEGGLPGEYTVVVKMNGEVVKSQNIHLEPGRSTEIPMLVSPGQIGFFNLTAGTTGAALMVDSEMAPDVTENNYWWLLCIALGVSTLLLGFIRFKKSKNQDRVEKS